MAKRQLRTIAKSMHEFHKNASDTYKESRKLDEKAENEFWELVKRLSEKYKCKIVIGKKQYAPDFIYSCNFIYSTGEYGKRTQWNVDFEGEFEIVLAGNLTLKQINEIKNLIGTHNCFDEWKEPNGFYSFYYFCFDFHSYWNEYYQ